MTRRSVFGTALALLSLPLAACRELRRYHSSVKFSLSTDSPTAGQPFQATLDYLDETSEPCEFVLLRNGVEVDRATAVRGSTGASLTAQEAGPHAVQFRRSDRMIAHRWVTVR